ncbi:WapI family immunity protein [Paracidovorax valerianellae]|uniref:Uncharacterized protein n=1 Tax=Paracidovorax valerianellae TaxID=187868 RepID=A0A1G7DPT4_9BURK|nr:hypothetical protein [Paracidovorax valerianellae]MDA8446682.1 hypothetical protein [Paracidovorax valerianellae]SDE53180.1 hypothetical protein SAMN05192589_1208 [Paracidovorax valerianellae]
MLNIDFDNLNFSMQPIARQTEAGGGPYMDWLKMEIKVTENDFYGKVNWLVMPAEIEKFKNSLSHAYQVLIAGGGKINPFELSGVEPNFSMLITVANPWGHLFVQYTLKDSPDGPTLNGSFGIDQSYLPQWIADLEDLLKFPAQ